MMEEKKLSRRKKQLISFGMALLVFGIVIGVNQYQLHTTKEKMKQTEESGNIANAKENQDEKPEAKIAMTQDEMEEVIAKHKKDVANTDAIHSNSVLSDETLTDSDNIAVKTVQENAENQSLIDFEGLQEMNPDVYAWISIPGTIIEYPMLQHATDNSYYLNYNIDGSFGYPGCIYTENMNSKDFTDANTLIYGHNMKNGTMFTDIHKYKDKDFFQENDKIMITTPEKILTYQIYANYVYDDRHLYYSFDFSNESVFETYLESIFGIRDMSANINRDIEVTSQDNIITLVTCIGNQPNNRLLLQAVLIEETEESSNE